MSPRFLTHRRTLVARSLFASVILALGACAQAGSPTPLPDLKRTSVDGMLTPAQQQQQIAEIARRKAEQEAAAVKTIEKTR